MTNYRDSKSKILVNAKSCSPSVGGASHAPPADEQANFVFETRYRDRRLGGASHAPPADEQANFVFETRYRDRRLVGAVHAPPADFDYKLPVRI